MNYLFQPAGGPLPAPPNWQEAPFAKRRAAYKYCCKNFAEEEAELKKQQWKRKRNGRGARGDTVMEEEAEGEMRAQWIAAREAAMGDSAMLDEAEAELNAQWIAAREAAMGDHTMGDHH